MDELAASLAPLLDEPGRMRAFSSGWHVAGGWAIDLFLARQRRAHKDFDIAIAREDQVALQRYFHGHRLHKVVDHQMVRWAYEEILELPVFQVFVEMTEGDLPALEFLLEEHRDGDWIYRRDPSITLPLARAHRMTAGGIPFLAPEVVLLFKAKYAEQDQADFEDTLPFLDAEAIRWLQSALEKNHPSHPWLASLR